MAPPRRVAIAAIVIFLAFLFLLTGYSESRANPPVDSYTYQLLKSFDYSTTGSNPHAGSGPAVFSFMEPVKEFLGLAPAQTIFLPEQPQLISNARSDQWLGWLASTDRPHLDETWISSRSLVATISIADGDVDGLIAAINTANATPGADTIELAAGGTYTLTAVDNTAYGPSGLPLISSPITINGNGATIERTAAAGTPEFRVLFVGRPPYVGSTGDLTINQLSIKRGSSTYYGGGILNLGTVSINNSAVTGNYSSNGGGGIYNSGPLWISGSTINNNSSAYYGNGIFNDGSAAILTLIGSSVSGNSSYGAWRNGGIVNVVGRVTVTNSTVSGNSASSCCGGAGGIFNWLGGATLTVVNSTISGNTGRGYAGGILNSDGGVMTISNSTVFGNKDTGGGPGGVYSDSGPGLKSSIVASNLPNDCGGPAIISLGYNIASDASCGLTGTGDMNSTDPLLAPLANNGGLTQTHAFTSNLSPAIDAGNSFGYTTDQRGLSRPVDLATPNAPGGDGADIGAFELQSTPTPTPAISAVPVMRTAGAGVSNSTIANVSDPVDPPNTLAVTINGGASATENGVTVNNISVSADGVVTADVVAASGAADASFTLTVTDSGGASATSTLPVIVLSPCPGSGTWNERAHKTASPGATNDYFGVSVAISGDTAIVGDLNENGAEADQGAAYVYTRSGTAWSQQAKLTASDGAPGDEFGVSVAISGDTVVVGARANDAPASNQGAAYVFTRSGTVWSLQTKLTASDGADSDFFGLSVSVSGDTVVVGAYGDDIGANSDQGSAYVFTRSGTVWSQQQKLTASDGSASDIFGWSVAVSGDTAVVGAQFDDIGTDADRGSAYVFKRSGTVWSEQQKLTASDGGQSDWFGRSVAVSGDTTVVGAPYDSVDGYRKGSAYIFTRSGTVWGEQQRLIASDGQAYLFGISLAVSGNTVVVGNPYGDTVTNTEQGSAYVFERSGTVWSQQQKLTGSDGALGDHFGTSVAVSGDTAIVGAYLDDVGVNADQGSAYIFTKDCTPPTITPGSPLTRQQGSAGSVSTIATVSDPNQPAGSLTVTATSVPIGISVTNISNTSGAVTAIIGADCNATTGANTVGLTVTNANHGTATGNLTVNVIGNTAPTLTYNNANVAFSGVVSVNPSTGPSDSGAITGIVVQTVGTYTGTISVDSGSGIVSISNAAPVGSHTITIRATDNCGLTTDTSFTLNVTDSIPPETSIDTNPPNPANSSGAAFTFSGTDTGGSGVAGIECNLDAGGFSACISPKSYAGLADGSHTIQVRAIDNAGNTDASPASFSWMVDTTRPTISAAATTAPNGAGWYNGNVIVHFTCTDFGSGIPLGACPADQTLSAEGAAVGSSSQTVTDTAGNTSTPSNVVTVKIDKTAPETVITDSHGITNGGTTLSQYETFFFVGNDTLWLAGFQCSADGSPYALCTSPVTYGILAVGTHSFQVRAFDAAGNVDASPASFSWDIVTPAQAVQNIITSISNMGLPAGVANSLTAPLNNINPNNTSAACGKLDAFLNQVNAKQSNGQLTAAQANQLRQQANAIKAQIGCT